MSLICVHLKDTSNTLLLALCCIQYIRTGAQSTRIHTEVCQLTNEWVSHDLECKSCKRLFIRRMTLDLVAVQVNALDCGDV